MRLLKVATPAVARTVVVPESVAPPGFAASATCTPPWNDVATFPLESSTETFTAGDNGTPAVAEAGDAVSTSCAGVVPGPGPSPEQATANRPATTTRRDALTLRLDPNRASALLYRSCLRLPADTIHCRAAM